MKFTNRDGLVRLYDGTATPYYLALDFDNGDFSAPLGATRPEELLFLHRNKAGADMHYFAGSDETLMAPFDISLSVTLTDSANTVNLINWILAMNDGGTTQVNSNTIATTEADTQRDGATNNPTFADSSKLACNLEILYDTSGTDLHLSYNEIYIGANDFVLTESDDGVNVSITAHCYGTVEYDASAFTSGNDVEA